MSDAETRPTRRELRSLLREALPLLLPHDGRDLRKRIRAALKRARKPAPKCEGCGAQSWVEERGGELLCTSCHLLDEHLERDPLCGACLLDRCRFRTGDAQEIDDDPYHAHRCMHRDPYAITNPDRGRCILGKGHDPADHGPAGEDHVWELDALRDRALELAEIIAKRILSEDEAAVAADLALLAKRLLGGKP